MKKRLFTIMMVLCIALSLLPVGASAAYIDNGEWAYSILKGTIATEGTYSNGFYQLEIYNDGSYTSVVIGYNASSDSDLVFISTYLDLGTSTQSTTIVIDSELTMPYLSVHNFTMYDPYEESEAYAYISSSFSSKTPLNLFNGTGRYQESGFVSNYRESLKLALTAVQAMVYNDYPLSIGDLGFTALADELGVPYGALIPEPEPSVTSGTLGENVRWELNDGVLHIYGSGPMYDYISYTMSGESPLYQNRYFIRYVVIDDGVTNIGGYVFDQCSLMEEIYIPPSVTSINYYAFSYCNNLSYVFIPYGLKSIGDGAFYSCGSLDEVYYHGNQTEWSKISVGQYNDPLFDAPLYLNTHYSEKVDRVNPTCTKPGTEEYWKCECGKIFSDENCDNEISTPIVIKALGHKWDSGKVTKQPTEMQEGTRTYTCTICGETRPESIPKLTPSSPSNPFIDVKQGQYYYEPVQWAVNHQPQITNGTSATTFEPDKTCTRGQAVTFLWRTMGCPEPKSTINPFKDVKDGAYYYKAVLWAVEKGITNGTSATMFSPEAPCTRAHVVTFLWRAEGKPAAGSSNPFKDVSAQQYYTDAVLWAVSRNITNGTDATHFSPDKPCTRGQIVTFLYRDMK